jgi:uncharacterized protein (TIGR02444 family)
MTDPAKPTAPIAPGDDLQLTGPHWTYIIGLYGDPEVQQACLGLQDGFGVDVSFLLTLAWFAAQGVGLDEGDVEALDQAIASWRREVVTPLRTIRRAIKPAAGHDAAVAGFRNRIKSIEIEAEQIEIALLVRAVDRRKGRGASGEAAKPQPMARTVETVLTFYAARAAAPAERLQAPELRAAIAILAAAAARMAAAGR